MQLSHLNMLLPPLCRITLVTPTIKKDTVADSNACYYNGNYCMMDVCNLSYGSHPKAK